MSSGRVDSSGPWFRQAQSDLRAAQALISAPPPMSLADAGCHVAAMCAQAIEKSLKGYVLLNGASPAMDHRPDKYLTTLLRDDPLLRYKNHHPVLAKLFNAETRGRVRHLFDLTPGGLGIGTHLPNTEYPWTVDGDWRISPFAAPQFADRTVLDGWLFTARRVADRLQALWILVDRAEG